MAASRFTFSRHFKRVSDSADDDFRTPVKMRERPGNDNNYRYFSPLFSLKCVLFAWYVAQVAATADPSPDPVEKMEKIFLQKRYSRGENNRDLESSATGYIFRDDGNGAPMYISLGKDNIDQYDGVLKGAGVQTNWGNGGSLKPLQGPKPALVQPLLHKPTYQRQYQKADFPSAAKRVKYADSYDVAPKTATATTTPSSYEPKFKFDFGKGRKDDGGKEDGDEKDDALFPGIDANLFKEAAEHIPEDDDDNGDNARSGGYAKGYGKDKYDDDYSAVKEKYGNFDDDGEDGGGGGGGEFDKDRDVGGKGKEGGIDEEYYYSGPDGSGKSVSHFKETSKSVRRRYKSPGSEAYVAPFYQPAKPHEVLFDQKRAPVKYVLPKHRGSFDKGDVYGVHGLRGHGQVHAYDGVRGRDRSYDGGYADYRGRKEGGDEEYDAHYSQHVSPHAPHKEKYAKGHGGYGKQHHYAKHGDKGEKGWKKYEDFGEDEKAHHDKHYKSGKFENKHGHKKHHLDEGEKYGEHDLGSEGEKGVKYGEKEAHKKGHKTKGFHNVYHKDEFKKDHKFYDDDHKHGFHDKEGDHHTKYHKKHGKKAHGGFHDSGFDEGHKGNHGSYHKDHFDEDHKGHKGKSGHESHYNHHDEYAKKGEHDEKKKYDFDDHHGHTSQHH